MMRALTCRCGRPLIVGQKRCTPCRKKHTGYMRTKRRAQKQRTADLIVVGQLSMAA